MVCYFPVTTYKAREKNETGKRSMVFSPTAAHSGIRHKLPCGQCIGCRIDQAKAWSVRGEHELKFHDCASFVTLTYRDECLPENGTLVREHLQGFHKRLHNRLLRSRGYGIRYMGCGEYGGLNGRPHYHSILFGYYPSDRKFIKEGKNGDKLYVSEELSELWPLGHAAFGDVTSASIRYVCGYITDKLNGDKAHERYSRVTSDGRTVLIEPEFAHRSSRPGIGGRFLDKFGADALRHGTVVIDGREVPLPRYYKEKMKTLPGGEKRLEELRKDGVRARMNHREDFTHDRRIVQEKVTLARINLSKRDRYET